MTTLPGWDSIESTSAIAHALHIAAIVVLALLVVAEGMALMYDSRKETLIGIAETNRESEQKNRDQEAETRRKTEVDALQKRLAEADKKVEGLQSQNVARRLQPSQKAALVAALSPF